MKTSILLTLGAVAFAAITINANANDLALSPHAKGAQTQIVAGTNNDQAVAKTSAVALSPKAAGSQIAKVSGTNNDPNALACRKQMTASPKAIGACADNPNMPGCNPVTVAPLK